MCTSVYLCWGVFVCGRCVCRVGGVYKCVSMLGYICVGGYV